MDKIEKFGSGSVLQHGQENCRVYVMKLHAADTDKLMEYVHQLAEQFGYTKLFAKIDAYAVPAFLNKGFFTEAFVPRFFTGTGDAFFMVKYLSDQRQRFTETSELSLFQTLMADTDETFCKSASNTFQIKSLSKNDAEAMSALYRTVFETYPFPIHDPAYICRTMDEGVRYFGAYRDGALLALSSAEVDLANRNAEMTDFAALPAARGANVAGFLLAAMEQAMAQDEISCLYTIARLRSPGMNKTFLKAGYRYTGTLVNNTNISGNIESMNVLYKVL